MVLLRSPTDRALLWTVLISVGLTAALSATMPLLFAGAVDALAPEDPDVGRGVILAIAFGLSVGLVGVIEQAQWLTFGPLGARLQRHLTLYSFRHVVLLPFYRLKSLTTYEVGRSVEKGLDAVREILSNLAFFLIPSAIELVIATVVIALVIDPLTAVVLIAAVFAYGWIANISALRIRRSTEAAMFLGQDAWGFGLDGVSNAELLQQADIVGPYHDRLRTKLEAADREWGVTFRQRAGYGSAQAAIFGIAVTFVLWRGALGIGTGALSVGDLVLLNAYVLRLLTPVETFARVYRDVHALLGEAKLLQDILAIESTPSDMKQELPIADAPSLTMRDGVLTLDGRRRLGPITFDVPPGGQLFVVGPSGAGKSSLLRVLSCLVPLDEGRYSIGGYDVDERNMSAFRSLIAVSQQASLMFDQSLIENVTLGLDVDESEVISCLTRLGLQDLLEREENGDPTVGERGGRLSGGERQRLSLARAMLKRPRLLLVDEPTTALDPRNRSAVIEIIDELAETATVIHVTHDLDRICDDDLILFLEMSGSIAFGTHHELMTRSSDYAAFVAESPSRYEATADIS
jgi:ABC-type bacteriocin/lantibiotic exporter with double-glycine peptidase domain